jgi:hypothetical protein
MRLAEDGGTVGGDLLFDAGDTLLRRGVGTALGRGRTPAPGRNAPRP